MAATLLRVNPAWNRLGPHVPLWFRRRLKELDPRLFLQFLPPRSARHPRGVTPGIYPRGVWDICRRLPRSRWLHPIAVWSLADSMGNYAAPGIDTLRMLKLAVKYRRQGLARRLEDAMDKTLVQLKIAKADRSSAQLHKALARYCSIKGRRQWTNRVSLRRETPGGGVS